MRRHRRLHRGGGGGTARRRSGGDGSGSARAGVQLGADAFDPFSRRTFAGEALAYLLKVCFGELLEVEAS